MQEDENTERLEEELDAVDALNSFIESECKIVIDMGVFVRKDEFHQRYVQYCKDHEVDPPSPGVLGSIVVTCFRAVWGDTIRGEGGDVPIWCNLVFKDHEEGGS